MITRILAIIKKEMRHIIRDPRTLIIVFVMPVVMVLLFGYALNMDVEHIPIGIIDYDNTPLSREIIRDFSASEYFDIESYLSDAGEIESLFQKRKIKAQILHEFATIQWVSYCQGPFFLDLFLLGYPARAENHPRFD